ncbi:MULTISPECIES: TOPRIM nucleotidyl transferase/hydrolase domain-containing protein [unclassified Streptomyces]|uniref:TOPRIM nucleotidyl transferase/hydrolase domain-containing protein n=1 Tax=unclassified Streptomyces TaxID=2593676 RepID=UPI00131AD72E|nr:MULTISPECIES: TOPRIM nucleotidyl transferase/hydrolase domain-containing protein [unclassified Streptomyces]
MGSSLMRRCWGEGTTDGALLEGCAERNGVNLGAEGITFVDVTGRDNLLLSHAIRSAMGVPRHVIFDGDAGLEERKRGSVRHLDGENRRDKEAAFEQQARKISGSNADLLGYLGESRSPWPATGSASMYTVCEDNLETNLGEAWPSWGERKQQLIDAGEGVSDKNAATYREVARTADGIRRACFRRCWRTSGGWFADTWAHPASGPVAGAQGALHRLRCAE